MRVVLLACGCDPGEAGADYARSAATLLRNRGAGVTVLTDADPDPPPELPAADLVIAVVAAPSPLLDALFGLAGQGPRLLLDYVRLPGPADARSHPWNSALALAWNADAVVVHGRAHRQALVERTGLPRKRVTVTGWPVCDPAAAPPAGCPLPFPIDPASLLLYVGPVTPAASLPLLAEGLARLRTLSPPVHVIIACDPESLRSAEVVRCVALAERLGVADHWHVLGLTDPEQRHALYRSAALLVFPSAAGGALTTVAEAQAAGLPIVAAAAGGLPEAVGDAGLTFRDGDGADLARQARRLLPAAAGGPGEAAAPLRVAVVSFRYGTDFAGGAETSLRAIAEALDRGGHVVEVFTTCTSSDRDWRNELPPGTGAVNGVTVHRFPVEAYDRVRHLEAARLVTASRRPVPADLEAEYLRHGLHSAALLDALRQRIDGLDAVIVGPYLFGLTHDVATAFPAKVLLLPCFHDEPLARLTAWRTTYARVGGLLYHTEEEKELTQGELRINHPNAPVIGTYFPAGETPPAGESVLPGRYLVYCGRYSPQKELPRLLDWARRYHGLRPDRFRFEFLGQGPVAIPKAEWATDLGFVSAERKRQVIAGAAALVLLSRQESLSLVALEAWSLGVPVVADTGCDVLAGQLRRSAGGWAVIDFDHFVRVLDELWEQPELAAEKGRRGRAYVADRYGSTGHFTAGLVDAVTALRGPLRELAAVNGRARPALEADAWRAAFSDLVEAHMHGEPLPYRERLSLRFRIPDCTVAAGTREVFVPVVIENGGTHAPPPSGPGRLLLRAVVCDAAGRPVLPPRDTPLPGPILPGVSEPAVVAVPVPPCPGEYQVRLSIGRAGGSASSVADTVLPLVVVTAAREAPAPPGPDLRQLRAPLARAEPLRRLPTDYPDVTTGWLAGWKRWLKAKLLNNFKVGYVDALSRQQSEVNEEVLQALHKLTEYCASLEHSVRVLQERVVQLERGPGASQGVRADTSPRRE